MYHVHLSWWIDLSFIYAVKLVVQSLSSMSPQMSCDFNGVLSITLSNYISNGGEKEKKPVTQLQLSCTKIVLLGPEKNAPSYNYPAY